MEGKQQWNAKIYDAKMGFVSRGGESLVELLEPKEDERIIDWGCGSGDLTAAIAGHGARVVGIDASPDMIAEARRKYGATAEFIVADGQSYRAEPEADAVFSNAALHWMVDASGAASSIAASLRIGGRFVAEFGAAGNIASVVQALPAAFRAAGWGEEPVLPWYFPTIGEYASLLEKNGLRVDAAAAFDRPTPLAGEETGLRDWLQVFAAGLLSGLQPAIREEVIERTEEWLKPSLYRNGQWVMDYRRIRLSAVKA